jgi:hypothetical protein
MEELFRETIKICMDKELSFVLEIIEEGESYVDFIEGKSTEFKIFYNVNHDDGDLVPLIKKFLDKNKTA